MTPEEKAYIAGIIDGEGSIMLIKFHENQFPAPCISISSTTTELLNWLINTIGKGNIVHKKNYNKEKHKESFTFYLKYDNAIELLIEIKDYLVIECKKKRAQFIIEKYKSVTLRNGRYSLEQLEAKLKFYDEFMKL